MENNYCEEGLERLCIAIIKKAARDYSDALKVLKYDPDNNAAIGMKKECERFFRSGWFDELTDFDGESMIKRLQKEVKWT